MCLRASSEATRPAEIPRQDRLQVLPFVLSDTRVAEAADLRVVSQTAVERGCAAAVQSRHKDEGM
jgi:hypothetical protein